MTSQKELEKVVSSLLHEDELEQLSARESDAEKSFVFHSFSFYGNYSKADKNN